MSILIENISKSFSNNIVLNQVNLEINSGALVALVGPSGSGKSTLLRVIAGFEKPDSGKVWLFGKDATNIAIQNREIGFVFQNYALFEHLTVFENIAFGLSLRDIPKSDIAKRVQTLIQLVQLDKFQTRYPKQLSGGQRQRVALARALAIEPKLLLLDEPFGALDEKVKKELCHWLKELHQQVPVTTLLVTHDQQEALEIATDIIIFKDGKIEQTGTPQEVYDNPLNPFIMEFIGKVNILTESKRTPVRLRPHEFKVYQKSNRHTFPVSVEKVIFGEPLIKIITKNGSQILHLQMSRREFFKFPNIEKGSQLCIEPRLSVKNQ